MRARYAVVLAVGLLIVGVVIGLNLPRPSALPASTASIQSFQRSGDPTLLVLNVMIGLANDIVGSTAREDAKSVTVSVRVNTRPGTWPAVGILVPTTVKLSAPLGDRVVLEEHGGHVLDLGTYEAPRQAPPDLGQVGTVEKGSFRSDGDRVDLRWTFPVSGTASSLADLRGRTVIVTTRTSFSSDGKMTLGWIQDYIDKSTADVRARIVVVVITLAEDPARAAVVRPSDTWRPLVAFSDAVDLVGTSGPEILQLRATPTTWFIDPSGTVLRRVSGRAMTRDEVADAIAAAR